MQKKCSKCKQIKAIGDFGKDSYRRDGFTYRCKKCYRDYKAEWRAKNKSKISIFSKKYRKNNKEKIKSYSKEYLKKNKTRIRLVLKEWKKKNPEKVKAQKRRYNIKHRDSLNLKQKEYKLGKGNREKAYRYEKKYAKKIKETLHDQYIKSLIVAKTNLKYSDIPKELIEAKRQHLKIKRIIKGE